MTRRHCIMPERDARPRSRGAFTLVELLVVIGVLAVLASVLLPALANARRSAKNATCLNNLRQIGIAAQLYWLDHDDRAFRWTGDRTNGGMTYWFGWLEDGEEGLRQFDPTRGELWPYIEGRGVDLCPEFDYTSPRYKPKANGASYGYGYNILLSARRSRPPVRVDKLARGSQTVVFADAAQVNDFQPPAAPDNPLVEEFYYLSPYEDTTHFRHRGRANAVFADGHAEPVGPAGPFDSRLPEESIGRLSLDLLKP